jgi:hypothetical protein
MASGARSKREIAALMALGLPSLALRVASRSNRTQDRRPVGTETT